MQGETHSSRPGCVMFSRAGIGTQHSTLYEALTKTPSPRGASETVSSRTKKRLYYQQNRRSVDIYILCTSTLAQLLVPLYQLHTWPAGSYLAVTHLMYSTSGCPLWPGPSSSALPPPPAKLRKPAVGAASPAMLAGRSRNLPNIRHLPDPCLTPSGHLCPCT